MSAADTASEVRPPFGPPDCPWRPMNADTTLYKNALYQNGKLNGDDVYIGRVFDGQRILIGTAIPKEGVCLYLDKSSEVKSSSDYEILTVDCGDPLSFLDMDLDNQNIFVAGKDEEGEILYVGRYVDSNDNTYYGWVSKASKSIYIPRDASIGPQVLNKDFGVLIHKFLDRLCICPPHPGFAAH